MRLKSTKTLYAYWDELRGTRIAPRRFEIEPSRIAEILPETFILEKVGLKLFRYRLAGTRVCDRLGSEFRGTDFLSCWSKKDRRVLEQDLVAVAQRGAVLVADVDAEYSHGARAGYEFLVLPLFHTGDTIERFMGIVSTSARADKLVSASLKSLKLLNTQLLWPARESVEPAEIAVDASSVFKPHVRTARVVRRDRRSFRVYDGGLSGQPKAEE